MERKMQWTQHQLSQPSLSLSLSHTRPPPPPPPTHTHIHTTIVAPGNTTTYSPPPPPPSSPAPHQTHTDHYTCLAWWSSPCTGHKGRRRRRRWCQCTGPGCCTTCSCSVCSCCSCCALRTASCCTPPAAPSCWWSCCWLQPQEERGPRMQAGTYTGQQWMKESSKIILCSISSFFLMLGQSSLCITVHPLCVSLSSFYLPDFCVSHWVCFLSEEGEVSGLFCKKLFL